MASGHVALNLAIAIDKFIHGRRFGERSGRFLHNSLSYDDRTRYTAYGCPSDHEAIVYEARKATRRRSQPTMAAMAIMAAKVS